MEILDSGTRKTFESGAVRDVQEGKGRCDLLPLDVISHILEDDVLEAISKFRDTKNHFALITAIRLFAEKQYPDLYTTVLEVSKHYEDGAKKYSDRNWEKGIPLHCFISSGVRHYLKFMRGDSDEPHDRAFVWNMLGALWTYKHYPELDDYTIQEDKNEVRT